MIQTRERIFGWIDFFPTFPLYPAHQQWVSRSRARLIAILLWTKYHSSRPFCLSLSLPGFCWLRLALNAARFPARNNKYILNLISNKSDIPLPFNLRQSYQIIYNSVARYVWFGSNLLCWPCHDAVWLTMEEIGERKKSTKTMVFGQHDNANLMRILFNSFLMCALLSVEFGSV